MLTKKEMAVKGNVILESTVLLNKERNCDLDKFVTWTKIWTNQEIEATTLTNLINGLMLQ